MTAFAGELVVLRAREPEEAPLFAAWYSDPETVRWWDSISPPMPAEGYAAKIANEPAPSYAGVSLTIADRATGTAIGWCGFFRPSPEHRNAEIGMLIGDPAYRGRGYGTDATRTLCRFGFDRMHLARITLAVFPANVAAVRAYERAGFAVEGVQRQAAWRHGAWHDMVHMAVFPETLR